jgi:hypothetical protein
MRYEHDHQCWSYQLLQLLVSTAIYLTQIYTKNFKSLAAYKKLEQSCMSAAAFLEWRAGNQQMPASWNRKMLQLVYYTIGTSILFKNGFCYCSLQVNKITTLSSGEEWRRRRATWVVTTCTSPRSILQNKQINNHVQQFLASVMTTSHELHLIKFDRFKTHILLHTDHIIEL